MRLAKRAAAHAQVPQLVLTGRPTAIPRYVPHGWLIPLMRVWLLAVAPAISTREDVFDALVGFELARLR
jgi:hypothetical protein